MDPLLDKYVGLVNQAMNRSERCITITCNDLKAILEEAQNAFEVGRTDMRAEFHEQARQRQKDLVQS